MERMLLVFQCVRFISIVDWSNFVLSQMLIATERYQFGLTARTGFWLVKFMECSSHYVGKIYCKAENDCIQKLCQSNLSIDVRY